MALYVICQLTGVLISKGYEETQMNIELLSDYFEIDQALTTEEILEQLNDVDAVNTLTGLDEENIMISLFASLNNKTKIITKYIGF